MDKKNDSVKQVHQSGGGVAGREGYLVNFCLASEEDQHVPSRFIEVNMHGSVDSSC